MTVVNKILNDNKYALSWGILGVVVLCLFGSIFLISKTVNEVRHFDDKNEPYYNSISMTGMGEVVAIADIASFNFSVMESAQNVADAQKVASEKINSAINYLKSEGIEEKDIKTTSYNVNPKYEWRQGICNNNFCNPGNSVLTGYEVSQNVDVKVRDTAKAGEILSGIGELGISNVSGLQFTIDDDESLKAEARSQAIEDAKKKAEEIARELGVDLVGVVSFYEENYPIPYYDAYGMGGDMMGREMKNAAVSPSLPAGENTITSRVTVTFEIK